MFRLTLAASLLASGAALADVPRISTDILPVHGLVSRVMEGVGSPDLLVDPGASPHGYALRPSQAAALQDADAVIWVSDGLAPWLEGPLDTLAADAVRLELMEVTGTTTYAFRENAVFDDHDHEAHGDHGQDDHGQDDHGEHDDEAHGHDNHDHAHDDGDDHDDHDHGDHGHDDHDAHGEHDDHDDHDDHADHTHDSDAHDNHGDHDDHGQDQDHDDHDDHGHDDHAHDHSGLDPHAWLDPVNARVWLAAIAETLAEIDPENAGTYRANAEAGRADLAGLIADIEARMAPLSGQPFVVFHDAYQYFETRFGLSSAGAISLGDASQPSAGRVAEIQQVMAESGAVCVFSEPQFDPGLVATVADGADVRTEVIDPLGQGLEPGADFYPMLIEGVAQSFGACLAGS